MARLGLTRLGGALTLGAMCAPVACTSLAGLTSGTPGDGGVDVAGDAAMDTFPDGSTDAVPTDAQGDGGCPGTAGPAPVPVGSFCIDSTEVTSAEYALFLASASVAPQPAYCSWNLTYVPSTWPPAAGINDDPVGYVDWCDAYAYCRWAGKRVCGKIGGGSIPVAVVSDPAVDQWSYACSKAGDGLHRFAYGAAYIAGICNTPELEAGGSVTPVSLPKCTGGFPGIFDMIGNVYEWEDSCDSTLGASDMCVARSGSWLDPAGPSEDCTAGLPVGRSFADLDFGFRCCSSP